LKTIGLIGGMSWESSLEYYRLINEKVSKKLGGLHSAKVIMHSVDFGPMAKLQEEEKWDDIGRQIIEIAKEIEQAGADFIVICTNTTHCIADRVEEEINIPLLHIADATAAAIKSKGINRVGLLGTVYTSKYPFYREKLESSGISVILPDEESLVFINSVIYRELCLGNVNIKSKAEVLRIIGNLNKAGAQGIVLGCTELPLLITPEDTPLPLFNTLELHAEAAVTLAM
jgi:aspartate racemase